jgi:amidase
MTIANEVAWLDATAQAELVRKKEVTPAELVEGAIARIEALNPKLNAVVLKMYDEARAAAKSAALADGPFRGVPFLIKDLLAGVKGTRLTSGCVFSKDMVSPYDSELVARYRRAGLVFVGKSNTPEFGIVPTTESKLLGACHNPWDPTRSPGGSSGGAASAVAAGIVPFAHAADGGGSIRIPASCCGLFGIKPTRGRLPLGPDIGDVMHGLVVEHAVTRSVRDSALLLDLTEGLDVGAPYAAPAKARPYAEEVRQKPGKLRIAMTTTPLTGVKVHADCVAAVHDTAKLLRELGHEVVEASLHFPGAEMIAQAFMAVWAGGTVVPVDSFARALGKKPTPEEFEPLTWALYELGKNQPLPMYLMAQAGLQRLARMLQQKWIDHDVWLTPTLAEPPAPLGTFVEPAGNPLAAIWRAGEYVPFTPMVNITGQPAMSVPLYWNAAGLPIGTHLIGRFGDEGTLFRLAAQLEEARPWAGRRPQISA